jgi:hypothetical protein
MPNDIVDINLTTVESMSPTCHRFATCCRMHRSLAISIKIDLRSPDDIGSLQEEGSDGLTMRTWIDDLKRRKRHQS